MPKLSIKLERKTDSSNSMICEDNGNNNARLCENQEDENGADGYDEDSSSFQSSQSSAYMMEGINSAVPEISNLNSGMVATLTTTEAEQLAASGLSTSEEAMKSDLNDFPNVSNTDLNEKVRKLQKTKQQIYLKNQKRSVKKTTAVVKEVTRSLHTFRFPLSHPPLTRRRAIRNRAMVSGYWIKSKSFWQNPCISPFTIICKIVSQRRHILLVIIQLIYISVLSLNTIT